MTGIYMSAEEAARRTEVIMINDMLACAVPE